MFKVGMGVSPIVPDTLSEEGRQFVNSCLQHDPCLRATISDLLEHNFIKVFISAQVISLNFFIYDYILYIFFRLLLMNVFHVEYPLLQC